MTLSELGSTSEPYSYTRGDVQSFTEERQGFTALLRGADKARSRGRPAAVSYWYRPREQPSCQQIALMPNKGTAQYSLTSSQLPQLPAQQAEPHDLSSWRRETEEIEAAN